ncbi:hypothetical protein DPMN_015009 [Dreissena polymorpha]|uniref:Uncharacterized protein n=1 Tax=Dreissena polymorpha TaxID=45954 RepID=A0A9D4NBW5_DREPO|nr:hypothetical protein DPMN_015009 [Dreissena polymorpha]
MMCLMKKTAPSPGGHFHDDWPKNVTLRENDHHPPPPGGHKTAPTPGGHFNNDWTKNVTSRKTAPSPGGHVFPLITTIFKLVQDIHITKCSQAFLLYKYKEKDPPGGHVFLLIRTIFELNRGIRETNVLTKFHEDWAKNVSSILFTCFHYIHIEKTAPPPGGHVFSPIMTIFELVRDIYKIDVKTKVHDN